MKFVRVLIIGLISTPVWSLTETELDQHVQALNEKYKNIEIVLAVVDHLPGEGTTESQITTVWDISNHRVNGVRSTLVAMPSQEVPAAPKKQLSPFSTKVGENVIPPTDFAQTHVRKRNYILNNVHAWSLTNQTSSDEEFWNGNKWLRRNARNLTQGSTYGRLIEGDLFLPELHMTFNFYHQLGDLYDSVFMYGQKFIRRSIKPGEDDNQWWVTYLFNHPAGQVKYRYLLEVKDEPRILETHQSIRLPDEGEVPMLSIWNTWSDGAEFDFPEKIVVQHLIDNNLIARTVTINVIGIVIDAELSEDVFRFKPTQDSNITDHTAKIVP
jgi:hypothetical protein